MNKFIFAICEFFRNVKSEISAFVTGVPRPTAQSIARDSALIFENQADLTDEEASSLL